MTFQQYPVFQSIKRFLALGVLGATALGASMSAQARDNVYWSVGIGAPGVSVGVGNAPPVYVQPAPVYVPPPVYVAPRPVYVAPQPVYYAPRPVVVRPAPVYYGPRGHYKPRHKHHVDHRRGKGHRR